MGTRQLRKFGAVAELLMDNTASNFVVIFVVISETHRKRRKTTSTGKCLERLKYTHPSLSNACALGWPQDTPPHSFLFSFERMERDILRTHELLRRIDLRMRSRCEASLPPPRVCRHPER
ncbi:hypothetical protein ACJRO7_012632 [Eucalyptus globulus]|uniref:Uncharacterized protein n=1 Tax=Eucalyptus globulus TaxID=34317 RepID=A0ABD3LMP0_EUCGL